MERLVARVGERGQVTIPKAIRDRYGLGKGTELEFAPNQDSVCFRKAAGDRDPVWSIFGILNRGVDTDAFIEEMRGR